MVKVTEMVIKCKKNKCHNFDSNAYGENPMWLQNTVTKIFAKKPFHKISERTVLCRLYAETPLNECSLSEF